METRNFKHAVGAFVLLIAGAAQAAQTPLKTSGDFSIEVKGSAAEQYSYASRLTAHSADLSDRNIAVLQSVAALEVIPQRWPGERALALRAYREMVSRLAGAKLHGNAIAICDKAIAFADKSPQAALFLAAKGRSLMWLGHADEARAAFDRATTGDFNRLDDFDKSSVLIDAVFFYERSKDFVTAAKHARARAKVTGSEFGRAEAMRKALELSMQANDHASAKADLAGLSDAAQGARMHALTPEESEVLRRIDAEIAQYRKKLGV